MGLLAFKTLAFVQDVNNTGPYGITVMVHVVSNVWSTNHG